MPDMIMSPASLVGITTLRLHLKTDIKALVPRWVEERKETEQATAVPSVKKEPFVKERGVSLKRLVGDLLANGFNIVRVHKKNLEGGIQRLGITFEKDGASIPASQVAELENNVSSGFWDIRADKNDAIGRVPPAIQVTCQNRQSKGKPSAMAIGVSAEGEVTLF